MTERKINYEAWATNMITFIREVGLGGRFKDWSGGFPCPIVTKTPHSERTLAHESDVSSMNERKMTLVERLRNPAWDDVPGEPARLNTEQTREAMDEAADLIGALWALVGDAARFRSE